MILPIRAYGDPVLRKKCKDITPDYPELKTLIDNMFETMYDAHGIGLAAPQIGLDIRLFVIDIRPLAEDEDYLDIADKLKDFKKVSRKETILIEYLDENFVKHTETFSDMRARVIQHEYDHIEGILFTDKLSVLKKKIIKGKLNKISEGNINVGYKMRFPK